MLFATDPEGRFTFLSAAILGMTGYTHQELIGQPITTVVDPSSMGRSDDLWAALVAEPGVPAQGAVTLRGKDGHQIPADIRGIGLVEDGAFVGTQGATRDMSDQVRLETELRRQAGELAAGEERAHLARELHDSVTQALFSMTMVTRSTELLLDRDPDSARAQLGQLRELQREALAEMRALIFELRPGNLEQDGLVRALKTHTSALQGRLGLPIVVESDVDERLPLTVEETLYRIAQEALHNIVKHAKATPGLGRPPRRRRRRRAVAHPRRRPGLRPDHRPRTATSAWPGCAPARTGWAARSSARARSARARPSRSPLDADDLERAAPGERRQPGRAPGCLPVHPRRLT